MKTLALSLLLASLWTALAPADGLAARAQLTTNSETQSNISVDIEEPTKPWEKLGTGPIQRIMQDTVWIADWSFDAGGVCNSTGWVKYDNRDLNDGSNFWCVKADFDTAATIAGNAAVLAKHDLCWVRDGYGNNWDYAIVVQYRGGAGGGGTAPTLDFDFALDSEAGDDFMTVECDSLGLSTVLADPMINPAAMPADYRVEIFRTDGLVPNGQASLNLIDFTPSNPLVTHRAWIRFTSGPRGSDEDGLYPSLYQAGLIVDHLVVGGTLAYSEDFTGASGCADPGTGLITGANTNVTFVNSAPNLPFGEWARLFQHITDNDKCTENITCAWLFTDPILPAYFADMAFGPGGSVVRNWLDDILVSPWVSLASTPSAAGTVLSFRWFPGNLFERGRIVQSIRVRSEIRIANTDTSTPDDSIVCVGPWLGTDSFSTLGLFTWTTDVADLSYGYDSLSRRVQTGFRVTDWRLVSGDGPPATLNTGPGPYLDRVRIGRRVLNGPVIHEGIDSRSQSQDAFGAVQNGIGPGEHHSPSTGATRRFDAVPFSSGADLGINVAASPNLITGDSIYVHVADVRGAGGVTSVQLYAAIVAGPHTAKVPPGATAGPGGFFAVQADTVRTPSGAPLAGEWFADLPDDYLRGGDEVLYFWAAIDAAGGFASDPSGVPGNGSGPSISSVAQAEAATGGLLGMSALPAIDWDPAYLAAVAAAPDGDVDPTPTQIANSVQKSCILYYNSHAMRRRSGPLHKTSFMHTLERLGYRGSYDVYDLQGHGNTNNQLGGRATVQHATGYGLIVQDTGRLRSFTVPDGSSLETEKVDQAGWYRSYLASGVTSEAGTATLFILGENVVQEEATNPLFSADFGVTLGSPDNGSGTLSPDVLGVTNFTFENGCAGNFIGTSFSLAGGCPVARNYDGLTPTTGTGTHRYRSGTFNSPYYAIVMNKNAALNWNTIVASFNWFDMRDAFGAPPGQAEKLLLGKVLNCTLPVGCLEGEDPVDVGGGDGDLDALPAHSALRPNVPNPFNPTTTIGFDLARAGHVELAIYDVSGRRVRTLADGPMQAGRGLRVVWNGQDEAGRSAASGVYFYRLVAPDRSETRKMVLLR